MRSSIRSGWRIGSLFGIPLIIDPSWIYILILFTLLYGFAFQEKNWGSITNWVAGLAMALLLFASVLLHELGHSLVARSQGIAVNSITLFLFGGVAHIDQESKTPGQAFQVAIAGPTVSFSLFWILMPLSQLLAFSNPTATVIQELARLNLVWALFNMIPGLPLDGGQVLKAMIWKFTGSRFQGVRWAARSGQWLGIAAIVLGLLTLPTTRGASLWLVLVGWFGLQNSAMYSKVADVQEGLMQLKASSAMTAAYRVVDATLTIRQFTDKYLLLEDKPIPIFFAASDGRYRGMVVIDDLRQMERSQWDHQTLRDIVHPLTQIPSVLETTPLVQVVDALETHQLRQITVLSPADAVAGVIDRGDIVRVVAERAKLPVSEAFIKRIKEEGIYPPGLPLPAIAKSLGNLQNF